MLRVPSFWGGVQLLGTLSGKTARLPGELAEWPDERTEHNWGMSLGVPQDGKVRNLFQLLCLTLGLSWSSDPGGQVIDLDPTWKRDDPGTGRELLAVLLDTRPERLHQLKTDPKANLVGGHGPLPDAWRLAFDALLSRPENFACAGTLRLYHDSHGHARGMSLHVVDPLFVGRLLAADGRAQVLVLNRQEMGSTKDNPGDLAYYLFDEDGRFAQGGVYAIAPSRQGYITGARLRDERTLSVAVGVNRGNDENLLHFRLVNGDLVLQGSTDPDGRERTAEEAATALPPMGDASRELLRREYHVAAPGR